jgi:mono/diheme cytochrome c family protein
MTLRGDRLFGLVLVGVLGACSSSAVPASAPVPAAPAAQAAAPQPAAAESATFYTEAQAARGLQAFRRVCSECHTRSHFRGSKFEADWRQQSAWDLFRTMVGSMPQDNPGGLEDQVYVDVIAYILELNGYAAGQTELTPTDEALARVPLGPDAARWELSKGEGR